MTRCHVFIGQTFNVRILPRGIWLDNFVSGELPHGNL